MTFALRSITKPKQRSVLNLSTLKNQTIHDALMDEFKQKSSWSFRTLEELFSSNPVVIVLEEVDTPKFAEEVAWLYQLAMDTKLLLIGIGNSALFTLFDSKKLQFHPYEKDLFQEIMSKKMEPVKKLFDAKCALLWANRVTVASGGDFRIAKSLMQQCINEAKRAKSMITLGMIQSIFTDYSRSKEAQLNCAPPAARDFFDMIKGSKKPHITVSEGRILYQEKTNMRIDSHAIRCYLQTLCDVNCMKVISVRNSQELYQIACN